LQLPDAGYDRHFEYLKRTEIVLPPIAEQKRIAAILDKAEELRGLRWRVLSQLDAIAQSIFFVMFGDPVTNPKDWKSLRFRDAALLSPEQVDTLISVLSQTRATAAA
jgi:type I restriction enzyme S subunit